MRSTRLPRRWLHSRLALWVPVFALISLAGCSAPQAQIGYFEATVQWDPGVTAQCFVVEVTDAAGTTKQTGGMSRAGKSQLQVAVYQDAFMDSMVSPLTVRAVGFAADCTTRTGEKSDDTTLTFVPTKVLHVTLRVTASTGDGGQPDGGPPDAGGSDGGGADAGAPDAGGPDAGSADGGHCTPVAEQCSNGLDDDCDGLIDCADSDCDGKLCLGGGHCTNGSCMGAMMELCTDGVDNDNNGLIDCADPACTNQACDDHDLCTTGEKCAGGACGGGLAMNCMASGVCMASRGCVAGVCLEQPFDAGVGTCDDHLACTTNDTCDGDGGCIGVPKSCPTPGSACLMSVCTEPSGTCAVSLDPAATCSDNDGCTDNDTCLADGGCAGTPVTCPPPQSSCQTLMGCSGGTCRYMNQPNNSNCPGGKCNGSGQCVPQTNVYPYVPSNFAETQLAGTPTKDFNVNCAVTINTSNTPTAMGSCIDPPTLISTVQADGSSAVVIWAIKGNLNVNSSGTITVTGTRPLIIAVMGDATVNGTITSQTAIDVGCATATNLNGGVWGGGGGGFGTAGAGSGKVNGQSQGMPPSGNQTLTPLRGGCTGGHGTLQNSSVVTGGAGGGALQISASGNFTINGSGVISVNGQGGAGASPYFGGGGGGGSGGAVLLEGGHITISGGVYANGGGGGEGSLTQNGNAGGGGQNSATQAVGGNGNSPCGGDGGKGASKNGTAGGGGNGAGGLCYIAGAPGGGGGGGGGVGRVRLNSVNACTVTGTISPAQTSNGNGC